MDTLDFIFLYMGIVGFILSIVSEIIIKIDDIMTDKKIDRYFNSIGVSGSKKWNHPVYNRLQEDHYILETSLDKTKFFFYLCEVIGLQLSVVKAGFYPMDLIASIIIIGYLEIVVVLIAVVHFSIFHDSYEDHLEYHEELQKRKNNPNSDDNLEHNKKKKPKKRPKKKNQNSKKKNKKKKIERRKRNELYQPIWH